jgi:sugar transferase (PEP-CTERM/EpsH1 system associated)
LIRPKINMKILVLLSRFPYPLEKGDKLRAYHQIKELSKKHEIILCSLTDQPVKPEWSKELEKFCSEIHTYQLKKPLIYWNTIKQTLTQKPFQIGYFYQRSIQKKINRLIEVAKPDHIYCQLIRTTEYVKNVHTIPKTVDFMDALSKGMERRSEISHGLRKWLFAIEGKRLSAYENRVFDYFNHHTIISEQDRNYINHPQKNAIAIIENGISDDFLNYKNDTPKIYDLVFTGNMNYAPNIECAEYLVNEIFPLLLKQKPGIKLLLAGANPNQRVKNLENKQSIFVSGWVEDIRESYAQGKIFVAPLFIGTGLQNKLLEAMAIGLPVVTTSLANNALAAVNGESILIAKDAATFANHIFNLLDNSDLLDKIAQNGHNFVASKFDWENSVKKLESQLLAK